MVDTEICSLGSMLVNKIEKAGELGTQALREFLGEPTDVCVVKEGYTDQVTVERRKQEAQRILLKYPDRVPVICERAPGSNIVKLDKRKFLVPKDLTMGQFMHVVRNRMTMKADQALFMFVDGSLPRPNDTIDIVYQRARCEDGFLYITYSGENTFG